MEKLKEKKFVAFVFMLCLLIASSSISFRVYAATHPAFTTIIEEGSMVETVNYAVFRDGSTYYAKNGTTGEIVYSGTNASEIGNNVVNGLPSIGGAVSFAAAEYEMDSPIVIVGGGPTPPTKTIKISGAGRFATIFKATTATNMFEVSNGASVVLEYFYIDMNNKNGHGIVGLNSGASFDRSFQKSYIHDIEIRGVVSGYWCMYLTNIYITNTWDNLYLRSGGGGIYMECDSVGYGNNHFGNIMVSLYGNDGIGVKLFKNAVAFSLNSWERLHIDGGSAGGASGNLALELDGSNYNSFSYLEIEHAKYCVKMGETQSTHGNTILSGYFYVEETDGVMFNLTANAKRNTMQNVFCSAKVGADVTLIYDRNTDTNAANRYYNLNGYSTGFLATGSYVNRTNDDACLLYGQMLHRKAQNPIAGGSFAIDSTGIRTVTITHALCLAPPLEGCQATLIRNVASYPDVSDWDAHVIEIFNSTITTIMVRINVTSASATGSATAKIAFLGNVNG